MKLMIPEASFDQKTGTEGDLEGLELGSVCGHMLRCWRECSDTWFSSKLLQELF